MTKEIHKIKGLGIGFTVNHTFAVFSISGDKDAVRLAARDAIFGLKILHDITSEFIFRAEDLKMKFGGIYKKFEGDQIDISIDIKAFDKLVLMFRYLEQIGIPLSGDIFRSFNDGMTSYQYEFKNEHGNLVSGSAQLGSYLEAIQEQADKDKTPLMIEDYERPQNQNFWFAEEIQNEAAQRQRAKGRAYAQKFNMFNDRQHMTLDDRIEYTKARMEHLIAKANLFVDRHPAYQNNRPHDIGWYHLQAYKNRKLEYSREVGNTENYDPTVNVIRYYNKRGLDYVRDDEVDAFRKLADKYWDLSALLRTLEETKKQLAVEKGKTFWQYLGF